MSKDNVKYIKLADTVINKLKNRTDKKSVEMKFKAGVPGLTESKVGGMPFIPAGGDYPGFTQYDPRDEDSDEVLLLQIDSFDVDGEWFLMWGDAGIANFFIKPEDLKNRNFTRVNYNWDCS